MNEIETHLYNLLAILNRDGGQYVSEHGLDAAVENAKKNYYDKVKQINELKDIHKKHCAFLDSGEECLYLAEEKP